MRNILLVLGFIVCIALLLVGVGGCLLFHSPEVELKTLEAEMEKVNALPPGSVEIVAKQTIKWVSVEVDIKHPLGKYNAACLKKANVRKQLQAQGKNWSGAWYLGLSVPGGDLSDFLVADEKEHSERSFDTRWQTIHIKKTGSAPLVCNGNGKISVLYFEMENWTAADMMNFKAAFRGEWEEPTLDSTGKKMFFQMQNNIGVQCDEVDWSAVAAYPKGISWTFSKVKSFVNSKDATPDLTTLYVDCAGVRFPKGFRCDSTYFRKGPGKAEYDSFMANVAPESVRNFTFNMEYSTYDDIRRFPNLETLSLTNVKDGFDWDAIGKMGKSYVSIRDSHITRKDMEQWAAQKSLQNLFLSHCEVDSDARKKCEELGLKHTGDWTRFISIQKKN